jgi:hypothetical protein
MRFLSTGKLGNFNLTEELSPAGGKLHYFQFKNNRFIFTNQKDRRRNK